MKKVVYTFKLVVEGRRSFPVDMLRYDSCMPWDQQNSNEIERSVSEGNLGREPTRITLRRFALDKNDHLPAGHHAKARWESFGWTIVSYEPEE
jgi:hypothetical protein